MIANAVSMIIMMTRRLLLTFDLGHIYGTLFNNHNPKVPILTVLMLTLAIPTAAVPTNVMLFPHMQAFCTVTKI